MIGQHSTITREYIGGVAAENSSLLSLPM